MPRYIDADALKPDYIIGSTSTNTECYRYVSLKQIVNAPIADVVERKRGKWMVKEGELAFWDVCSVCRKKIIHRAPHYKFCPNCGAEMKGEGDGDGLD